MSKLPKTFLILIITFIFPLSGSLHAQLVKDLSRQIEVPDIINLQSSETHLYVLSESEGLVVFRTYSDSLQWLYSSTGMQQRGNILESDIRFAYLYGDSRRMTVIEPTSVLGVYSSTVLPDVPKSAKRIGDDLYIALGNSGFGRISLESPESVDSDIEIISRNGAADLASDGRQTLYVLGNENEISIYTIRDEQISLSEEVEIGQDLSKIFLVEGELMGSDKNGNLFLINSNGRTRNIAETGNSVDKISTWNARTVVKTQNGDIWLRDTDDNFSRWKSGNQAGNFFTITGGNFWISEYNKVVPVIERGSQQMAGNSSTAGNFKLKEIKDVVLPFPRPLLLPIEFENSVSLEDVSLSYNASFNNAQIRGNTFYWQPSASQSGRHNITITASMADGQTDSTQFNINLTPFNSPPRFSPTRTISIPVDEPFELEITAVDPDGMNQSLIRYLGVDMPNSANVDEQSGIFSWTPSARQVGEHTFRVIATDQYGAAASQDYTVRVIEVTDEPLDEDIFEQ